MATRSVTPRANNEGGIGTTLLRWATGFIKILTVDNITSSDLTASRSVVTDVNKKLISGSNTDTELAGAVSSKHTQGTDQGLDTGGANAITAATLKTLNDTTVPGKEDVANKSTNVVTDAASNTKYPSVKAFKDYADGLVVGLIDDRGSYNASGNAWPTTGGSGTAGAILKGDLWYISVAGTLGGVSVIIGSSIRALADSPGSTAANWDILNVGIGYTPENVANRRTTFQATPDDTHYPSEKLVKDSIDGKIAASITDGDTTHAPDGNSVFDALALKAPVTSPALVTPTRTTAPADNDSSLALATTAFAKSQDAVLHRDPDQGVALTAAASGSSGITVADNANINFDTGNFALVWKGSLPDWTPAVQTMLYFKYAANTGYYLCRNTNGTFEVLVGGDVGVKNYNTAAYTFIDGTVHEIVVVVNKDTASVAGSIIIYIDSVVFSTVVIDANTTGNINNAINLQFLGYLTTRYAGTCIHAYTLNFAPTAAEVLNMYRNGIPKAWQWGSQTSLVTGNDSTFAGASNWANVTLGSYYDETTGGHLTITASAVGQYCNLGAGSGAIMTPGKKYRLQLDSSALTSTWHVSEAGWANVILDISSEGTLIGPVFTCQGTNGITVVAQDAASSVVIDNVLLYQIGATLALLGENAQPVPGQILDASSNALHALMPATGATLTRPKLDGTMMFLTGTTDQFVHGGTTRAIFPSGNYWIDEIYLWSAGTPTLQIGDDAATPATIVTSIALVASTWTKVPLLKNSTDHDDLYVDFTAGGAATKIKIRYHLLEVAI